MPTERLVDVAAKIHDHCRICGSGDLVGFLDLGTTPLANSYLRRDQLAEPEPAVELALQMCPRCGLSQLTRVVDRDAMFRDYLYVSSTSATFREHCAELAATAARVAGAGPGDLVLDIASNDGFLLSCFRSLGARVVGVDPALNLAADATARGIPTIADYWSVPVANDVVDGHGRPRVVTATNVVAHVDDLHEFVRALDAALAPEGIFVLEVPYLLDFVQQDEFDTAYHEHLSYLGVRPLRAIFAEHGYVIFDVQHFPDIRGGTIRVFAARTGRRQPGASVEAALAREAAFGIADPRVYVKFGERVRRNMDELVRTVRGIRARGGEVWAYGASAKGNTLMNFARLGAADVPVAIDDNPKKWGLYTPGAHMRIAGPAELRDTPADHLLLLAWNFEREIVRRSRDAGYRGAFIRPVPAVSVFS